MKKLLFGLLGLLIVVAAGIYIVSLQAGSIVKSAAESYGPQVLGTHVELEEVDVSVLAGHASLRGFAIQNPSGFSEEHAFASDAIDITLDVMSLFSDPVVIHSVRVEAPTVRYEVRRSGNNIGVLQENARQATAHLQQSLGMEAEAGPGRTIIIERLVITKGEVIVAASELDRQVSVGLPNITLENLGGTDGAAVEGVMATVMRAIHAAAAKAIASGKVEKALRGIIKDPGIVEDSIRDLGETVEEGLGGTADNGINKLLNR